VYTSKIISSHRDLVALVFYGTEQSKNPRNSFKHVYVYHDLDEPGEMLHFSNEHVITLYDTEVLVIYIQLWAETLFIDLMIEI